MVIIVCTCSVLLALVNCLVAWFLWRARCRLIVITETLIVLEEAARSVLVPAPLAMTKAQLGGMTIKQRYRTISRLLRQLRLLFSLLSLGYTIWQQQARRRLIQALLSDRQLNSWGRLI
ncbi:MAG: hypothetical protein ACFB4I_02765 [Cyanophyceae cyanobacterium]